MSQTQSLLDEVKAVVQGQKALTKVASQGASLSDSYTPAQMNAVADRLEKFAQLQEATGRILEMRKTASEVPASEAEMRKIAYQNALRELGYPEGVRISPFTALFGVGGMDRATAKLAHIAKDAAQGLLARAVITAFEGTETLDE